MGARILPVILLSAAGVLFSSCTSLSDARVDLARDYAALASEYASEGRTTDAIRSYSRALELYPDFHEVSYQLALLYIEEENFVSALSAIEDSALSSEEEKAVLAFLYARNSRYDLALDLYQELLSNQPNQPDLLYNTGLAQLLSGNRAGAGELFDQALEADPGLLAARVQLALLAHESGNEVEVILLLQEYRTALEEFPSAAVALGDAYVQEEMWQEFFGYSTDLLEWLPVLTQRDASWNDPARNLVFNLVEGLGTIAMDDQRTLNVLRIASDNGLFSIEQWGRLQSDFAELVVLGASYTYVEEILSQLQEADSTGSEGVPASASPEESGGGDSDSSSDESDAADP